MLFLKAVVSFLSRVMNVVQDNALSGGAYVSRFKNYGPDMQKVNNDYNVTIDSAVQLMCNQCWHGCKCTNVVACRDVSVALGSQADDNVEACFPPLFTPCMKGNDCCTLSLRTILHRIEQIVVAKFKGSWMQDFECHTSRAECSSIIWILQTSNK